MLPSDTLLQGRFLILDVLSKKGGMGIVYLAKDQRLGGTVVVKEIRYLTTEGTTGQELQEELLKAFEREAKLLANLKHPALPRVIDCFAEGNRHFIVMDYVEGKDLEEVLKENRGQPFPVDQVLAWADELLDALDHLHRRIQPIVHRDIKPANLKLTPHGKIMLLDFGLAKGSVTGSKVYSIFGYTKEYAPLEQIEDKGTDIRSDLFSLAVTLYQLLTGVLPPDALTRVRMSLENQRDPIKPVNDLNPQVPPIMAKVLHQALSLIPDVRPATAKEMQQALREIRRTLVLTETPTLVQKPTLLKESPTITRSRTAKLRSHELPERAAREKAEPIAGEAGEDEKSILPWAISLEDSTGIGEGNEKYHANAAEPDFEEAHPSFSSALVAHGKLKAHRSKLLVNPTRPRRSSKATSASNSQIQVARDDRRANTNWPELTKDLAGLALLFFGVVVLFSLFSYDPLDLSSGTAGSTAGANAQVRNWIGPVGASLAAQLYGAFGWLAWGMAVVLFCSGWFLLRPPEVHLPVPHLFGWLLVLFAVVGLLALSDLRGPHNGYFYRGGWVGRLVVRDVLVNSLNVVGAFILLATILLAGILISTPFSLSWLPNLLDSLRLRASGNLNKLLSIYLRKWRTGNDKDNTSGRFSTRRAVRQPLRTSTTKRDLLADKDRATSVSENLKREGRAAGFSGDATD